jgi:hypothetical protein
MQDLRARMRVDVMDEMKVNSKHLQTMVASKMAAYRNWVQKTASEMREQLESADTENKNGACPEPQPGLYL